MVNLIKNLILNRITLIKMKLKKQELIKEVFFKSFQLKLKVGLETRNVNAKDLIYGPQENTTLHLPGFIFKNFNFF